MEAGLRPLRENDYFGLSNMFFPATFTKRSCLRAHEATRRQRQPLRFLRLNDFFRRFQQVLFPSGTVETAPALGRPGIWQSLYVTAVFHAPCGHGHFCHRAFTFISQLMLTEKEQTGERFLPDAGT